MTGNVELIKIINTFGHGISYTKLAEVDTAYAIEKISTNLGLISEELPGLPNINVNLDLNTQEMSRKKNLIWFLS